MTAQFWGLAPIFPLTAGIVKLILWHKFSGIRRLKARANARSAGMRVKKAAACLLTLAMGAGLVATSVLAQGGNQYKARLAPAPPLGLRGERGTDRPTPASHVAGIGSATATLSGRKLTVTGSFEKMVSPPTVAKVGVGLATGARLDLVYDLTVTKVPQA